MTQARVSVVIPAYNCATSLAQAIESALLQTTAPDEIIVIDDGSTDDTRSVAEQYRARTTWLSQSNAGPAAARNRGIRTASGEFVALLDADDYWAADKLEKQLAMTRPDTVLNYTQIQPFNERGLLDPPDWLPAESIWPAMRTKGGLLFPSACLVRREAALALGGFREDMRASEDWEFFVRLRRFGDFQSIAERLVMYRVSAASVSKQYKVLLNQMDKLLPTLVEGLPWPSSAVVAHKVRSKHLRSAAKSARDLERECEALRYAAAASLLWPFEVETLKVLGVQLRRTMRRGTSRPAGGVE